MIRRNPYNVLGLLAGVPEKEVAKRKAQINAYLNVGKEIAFPEDIPIAGEGLVRTKESVAQAIAEIDQYSKRAVHALYWFTEGGRADGPALAHLRDGDVEKARDIWYRVASAGELTSQSISSCSNLGTLALLNGAADSDAILVGVRWKAKLFGSEHLPELLTRMSDASIAKDVNGVATKWSEQLATWLIPTHALDKSFMEKLGETFALLAEPIRSSLRKPFEQHYEKEIERMVAHCQMQRKKVPGDADNAGAQLLKSGKAVLPAYRGLLGSEAIGFQHAVDLVAEELLECAINHFNAHLEDDTIRTEAVRSLVKAAGAIAEGRMLVARIEDNAKTMEEYFADDGERRRLQRVKPAMDGIQRALQSVDSDGSSESKDPFVSAVLKKMATSSGVVRARSLVLTCTPLLKQMAEQLGSKDDLYANVSSAVANRAIQLVIEAVNGSQQGSDALGIRVQTDLTKLRGFIAEAQDAMRSIGALDMVPELRKRFEANNTTLNGIAASLQRTVTRPNSSGCMVTFAAIGLLLTFMGWMLT